MDSLNRIRCVWNDKNVTIPVKHVKNTSCSHSAVPYLFRFLTDIVPSADLVVARKHVHGHHADGEGDGPHDHFPGVGGHKQPMHAKKPSEHDFCIFWREKASK